MTPDLLDSNELLSKIHSYFRHKSSEEIEEDLLNSDYYKYEGLDLTYFVNGDVTTE